MEKSFSHIYLAKLKLFRELKAEDKRLKNDSFWEMQKAFLQWIANGHRQLSASITPEFVKDRLLEHLSNNPKARFSQSDIESFHQKILSELARRDYVIDRRNPDHPEVDLALISDKGMLMSQVINDLRKNWFSKMRYRPITILLSLGAILGLLITYSQSIKLIVQIWK